MMKGAMKKVSKQPAALQKPSAAKHHLCWDLEQEETTILAAKRKRLQLPTNPRETLRYQKKATQPPEALPTPHHPAIVQSRHPT
jgi:hypothetical protein